MPLLTAIIMLGIFTLTRLGLMLYTSTDTVPPTLWPMIFLRGLWFDLLVTAVFVSPVCLYEAILPNALRPKGWHQNLRLFWLWGLISLLLFGAAAEATFWLEFSTRLNFIAVDYLIYTHEVIGNIRQSYPVGWIFLAISSTAGCIGWLLRKIVRKAGTKPVSKKGRMGLAIMAFALPAIGFSLGNMDQMEGSGNTYAEELSGNGYFTFAAALRSNELDYETFYRTMPQEEADALLKQLDVERTPLSAILKTDMNDEASDFMPFKRRPKNIVLISVESLSASFVGAYGSAKGLTPNLDLLAREGLVFQNVFATGTRTVRGLEAMSIGTPPIPGQAIVRRPNSDHLSTIGNLLKVQGFSTFFIYGGYGYFDNMNVYFSGNDYEIVDRMSFPKESVIFENIWGVADEVLFNNAVKAITRSIQRNQPFFAHIMTTSNHRPYTYPQGRIDIPSPGGREGAVKYTDYAVGKFVRDSEQQKWFKDTLFVITADHCSSVAGKTKLPVEKYHIPLIFYGPDIVEPGFYKPMGSQIDLMPTLIEVLGKKGDDHFFGRSFFEDGPGLNRTFLSNYQALGYLRNGIMTVLLPNKRVESYRVDPVTYEQSVAPVEPELLREAIAYYQTASKAFKEGALQISP
ncbi:MAG: LTA synthase family protein [Proteobacteria bacterium]|nr:LTA synthase family protein [Pseudomonadota bacterium]MBU4472285.1 LTA synthase family protein [Pseudomonadota bacterium]MCG2751981.1 LTA synthase family protein [Desulfobacteraceae bacterium]